MLKARMIRCVCYDAGRGSCLFQGRLSKARPIVKLVSRLSSCTKPRARPIERIHTVKRTDDPLPQTFDRG